MTKTKIERDSAKKKIAARWGDLVYLQGWTAIPNVLIEYQSRLELTDQELVILMHLIRFWWDEDKKPFPSIKTLAKELGKNERSVQRILNTLENKQTPVKHFGAKTPGYIERISRFTNGKQTSNEFSFDPLKKALDFLVIEDKESKKKRTGRQASRSRSESPSIGGVSTKEVIIEQLKHP